MPGGAGAVQAIIEHELGHVVGLDHVADPTQLMNPELEPGVTGFGDGDRRGLALLGEGACFPEI
jgi:predicted Zn-dependent protease